MNLIHLHHLKGYAELKLISSSNTCILKKKKDINLGSDTPRLHSEACTMYVTQSLQFPNCVPWDTILNPQGIPRVHSISKKSTVTSDICGIVNASTISSRYCFLLMTSFL